MASLPIVQVGYPASPAALSYDFHASSANSLGSLNFLRPRQQRVANCLSPQSNGSLTPKKRCIPAIDTASTKLLIPITSVEPTLAFQDDGLVPGLCRLYMEGRCRQGDRCFQVHANPTVVEQLRKEAFHKPNCCHVHGATCNYSGFPLGLTVTIEGAPTEKHSAGTPLTSEGKSERESGSTAGCSSNGDSTPPVSVEAATVTAPSGVTISLHSLCPTRLLWTTYAESGSMHIVVPRSKICREHLKGLCRFGDECSFLHVCREVPLNKNGEESRNTATPMQMGQQYSGSMQDMHGHGWQNTHTNSLHQQHFGQSMLVPQSGSFVENSLGGSFTGGRHHFSSRSFAQNEDGGDRQPLLRPMSPQASATSLPQRGSFSHNPYAEASSLQN